MNAIHTKPGADQGGKIHKIIEPEEIFRKTGDPRPQNDLLRT